MENKVKAIIEALSKLVSKDDDLYEKIGILVSDIDDILSAKTTKETTKQKFDALMTLAEIQKAICVL